MLGWIRHYFDHKDTLRRMRTEDARDAERYRRMFWEKVHTDLTKITPDFVSREAFIAAGGTFDANGDAIPKFPDA